MPETPRELPGADQLAEAAHHTEVPCTNCGDPHPGRYCRSCGQRRGERRISLRRMLAEVIEDQFSINSTLPRTLRALFFQPGFLSAEYVNGRVERYIPPFRLYLVSSVVFFLLLSFVSGRGQGIVHVDNDVPIDTTMSVAELIEQQDSARARQQLNPVHTGWGRLDTLANRRVRELATLPPREAATEFSRAVLQRAPTAVFLMLPFYALLLHGLYFRQRRYYVEHFVFGLHTHAFAFLLFTIMLIAGRLPWIGLPLMLWLVLYGFLALRRYYGQGWLLTLVKYGLLGVGYSVVFTVGLVITVIAALLLG
jgi:hypothetical protein